MAFPIPSHLPRKSTALDVSSKILSRIDEATYASLTASLATSWLVELDESILSTKERLHDRIQADLPSFEHQFSLAKSVQTRLQSLSENVRILDEAVSHPQSGLIPTLVRALTEHAALSQEYSDAALALDVFSHLLRCEQEFASLSSLVHAGQLPDAVKVCRSLQIELDNVPLPLNEAKVLANLKQNFRVTKDFIEEQLNDAYARSIILTQNELALRTFVQVRKSETTISLSAILSTLSPASVSSHLTTFRRDFTAYFVDRILTQPTSVSITTPIHGLDMQEHKLTLFPSPPNTEVRSDRLENLALVLNFLDTHMFPHLPEAQKEIVSKSLYKPIATGILNHLLIPSLPSSFSLLPTFLDLVQKAVFFEERHVENIFGDAAVDKMIKEWANGVGGHYERKRRVDIFESARVTIMGAEDDPAIFSIDVAPEPENTTSPTPAEVDVNDSKSWGFDDDEKADDGDTAVVDETGWGFDDDDANDNDNDGSHEKMEEIPVEDDSAAAWGWNEDEGSSTTDNIDAETAWDDPWNDEPAETNAPPTIPTSSSQKETAAHAPSTTKNVNTQLDGKSPTSTSSAVVTKKATSAASAPKPPAPPRESYLVSSYVKQLVKTVEDVLDEGKEFAASGAIPSTPSSSSSSPGSLIFQSAISVLDLFRALYPVKFGLALASPERAMRFSNDCIYLSGEIARILRKGHGLQDVSQKLVECQDNLQVLGDSWFDDTIERERQTVDEVLLTCQGFTGTTEQDWYDECESAISRVLQHVRLLAQRWKGVLTQTKYYLALGLVVDAALSRMLDDILALPDITADESHKLSELCRIFNSLEGLFFVNINEPSPVAAYVPSWLKFSYLSELLEASIADISYLFEIGALVDFEVDELVSLVRALFADTPLRATTINKFLGK